MEPSEMERKKREAEEALRKQQELSRAIENRAPEVRRWGLAYRERRVANMFREEYDDLIKRGHQKWQT